MKPTVKSFLALAGDKELTVHIARYKSDSADGYSDEEVFCGKSNDVPECYTNFAPRQYYTMNLYFYITSFFTQNSFLFYIKRI